MHRLNQQLLGIGSDNAVSACFPARLELKGSRRLARAELLINDANRIVHAHGASASASASKGDRSTRASRCARPPLIDTRRGV
jgi:hypothetical protein